MIDVIMKGFPQTWVQISANDEDKGEETNAVSGWKRGRVRQGGDRTKVWLTMEGEVGCVGERKVEEVWPGPRGRKRESGGEGQDEDDGKINWDGGKKREGVVGERVENMESADHSLFPWQHSAFPTHSPCPSLVFSFFFFLSFFGSVLFSLTTFFLYFCRFVFTTLLFLESSFFSNTASFLFLQFPSFPFFPFLLFFLFFNYFFSFILEFAHLAVTSSLLYVILPSLLPSFSLLPFYSYHLQFADVVRLLTPFLSWSTTPSEPCDLDKEAWPVGSTQSRAELSWTGSEPNPERLYQSVSPSIQPFPLSASPLHLPLSRSHTAAIVSWTLELHGSSVG